MRMFIIAALTIVSGLFYCLFTRGEAVCVMDAHYDGSTAQVIVNKCSGQQKLATALEFFQNNRSDSFGVKPPLY